MKKRDHCDPMQSVLISVVSALVSCHRIGDLIIIKAVAFRVPLSGQINEYAVQGGFVDQEDAVELLRQIIRKVPSDMRVGTRFGISPG